MMIEQTVQSYLAADIDVPVLLEVPEGPEVPDRFVVLERIAGGRRNLLRTASFAIQSYSLTSMYDAAVLDEKVRDVMDDMAAILGNIGACRMASNYNFTDTSTKRYRYQCTYDITYVEE